MIEMVAAFMVALGFLAALAIFDGEQERRHKELLAVLERIKEEA